LNRVTYPAKTDLLRKSAELRLKMIATHRAAGAGHLGSSLSIVEILAVLFHAYFRWNSEGENPNWGDRFVLSKGHAALGLYCVLDEVGKLGALDLKRFGQNGSPLEPHPNEAAVPTVHASTGSLGQGLSIGVGLALGSRLQMRSDRTFVVVGDGELNEGQIWEAMRSAAHLRLSNFILVLDDNGMQQDGPTPDILPVGDAVTAFEGMGWFCAAADGHDTESLTQALDTVLGDDVDRPKLIHATTVKGKGIEELEGKTESHYPPPMSDSDYALLAYMLGREGLRDF